MSKSPLCKTYLEGNRRIAKLEKERRRKLNSCDIEEKARSEMAKSLSMQIDDVNNSPEYQESKDIHNRLRHLYIEIKDMERKAKEMKKEKDELERKYMGCDISSYNDLLRFINDNCVSEELDPDGGGEITISLPAYKEFGGKTICLYFPNMEGHLDYPGNVPGRIMLKGIQNNEKLANEYLKNYDLSLNDIITEYTVKSFLDAVTKYLDQYGFIKNTWRGRPDYSPYGLGYPSDAWEFLNGIRGSKEVCESKDFRLMGSNGSYKSLDISCNGVFDERNDGGYKKDYDSGEISKYLILER